MLMYAHYEEIDWPYLHRQAAKIAVLKNLTECPEEG